MTVNEKTAVKLGSYDLQRLMVKIKMNKTRSIPVTISETVDNNSDKDEEAPDNSKSTKTHKKFTCKQKIALVILAIVDFMSFCSMSIMAPFYPQEAATKGMSESLAGFVFGFYALVIFLSSPVFGKTLPRIGLNCLFTGGVLLSGLCSLVFGTLNLIENYTLFTTLSFVIRGLGALGSSAYSTASYVIIVNVFPEHAGAVRGLLETFVGLGMSVGPALGGLLFAIGGFGLPFYVIGLVIILIAPLNAYLLPSSELKGLEMEFRNHVAKRKICYEFIGNQYRTGMSECVLKCSLETKTGSFTKMMKIPSLVVTCCIIVVIAMTWSFLDPTLEPHLRKFKLSPGNIGLIFLLLSAMYGIFSPAWGWVTDRMDNYWWLMTSGLFFSSVTLLFLGPSPLLSFLEDSIWLNIVALSLLGVSVAMALMPTYQSVLDSAFEQGFEDNLGTHSVIAGLWSCVYSLGEVLGPIIGGALLQNFGFPVTSTVFSFLNLLMAVLGTAFFCTRNRRRKRYNASNEVGNVKCCVHQHSEIGNGRKKGQPENGKWTTKLT